MVEDAKTRRLHFVARRAMQGYDKLSTEERIELLLGFAEFLPGMEAEAARATAWSIQTSEAQQLKFRGLLGDSEA